MMFMKVLKDYLQHKALKDGLHEQFRILYVKLVVSSTVLDNNVIQRVLGIHVKTIKGFFDELSNDGYFWNYIIEKIVEAKRREEGEWMG